MVSVEVELNITREAIEEWEAMDDSSWEVCAFPQENIRKLIKQLKAQVGG